MNESVEDLSAENESKFHTYRTHRVPLFVHIIWVLFTLMAVYYTLTYMFPSMQAEFVPVPKKRVPTVAPSK